METVQLTGVPDKSGQECVGSRTSYPANNQVGQIPSGKGQNGEGHQQQTDVPYIQDGYGTYWFDANSPPQQWNGQFQHSDVPRTGGPQDDALTKSILSLQMEYYFSVGNLCKDLYLRSLMDEEGWVSLANLGKFNRVRAVTQDIGLIAAALESSKVLELSPVEGATTSTDEGLSTDNPNRMLGDKVRLRQDWQHWVLPPNQRR
eukprot:Platyproteum_vivax@DN5262_c0_g1_i1.p1